MALLLTLSGIYLFYNTNKLRSYFRTQSSIIDYTVLQKILYYRYKMLSVINLVRVLITDLSK